jgi:hypothetical protein
MTQAEINNWLKQEVEAYTQHAASFDETAFFRQPHAEKWSLAQHTQHLIQASAGVAGALRNPDGLKQMFGTTDKPSEDLEAIKSRYIRVLADLTAAGKFPYRHIDTEGDQTTILGGFGAVNQKLSDRLMSLSESDMDTLQMPHPVLGLLSVREMLIFIAYHVRHHLNIVETYAK